MSNASPGDAWARDLLAVAEEAVARLNDRMAKLGSLGRYHVLYESDPSRAQRAKDT